VPVCPCARARVPVLVCPCAWTSSNLIPYFASGRVWPSSNLIPYFASGRVWPSSNLIPYFASGRGKRGPRLQPGHENNFILALFVFGNVPDFTEEISDDNALSVAYHK